MWSVVGQWSVVWWWRAISREVAADGRTRVRGVVGSQSLVARRQHSTTYVQLTMHESAQLLTTTTRGAVAALRVNDMSRLLNQRSTAELEFLVR